jgi:cobyric acid synthase
VQLEHGGTVTDARMLAGTETVDIAVLDVGWQLEEADMLVVGGKRRRFTDLLSNRGQAP